MGVPHKGMATAFQRTYNSQSRHDVAGHDGAQLGMYGNGWTNTFDAHISGSLSGSISVWDGDGARYDYTYVDGTNWAPPAGQHASLVYDGGCGMLWTNKQGVSHYFWVPSQPTSAVCPSWWWPSYGGYAGRLYQIIGRNRNTYFTLNYSWDNNLSGPGASTISSIAVQAESGLTATMTFADVNGHRLLQTLRLPDYNATTNPQSYVQYSYDANGNLTYVGRPPNNTAGVRPAFSMTYTTVGADTVLASIGSPRYNVSCGTTAGCMADGGGYLLYYAGSSAVTSAVSTVQYYGSVNPAISDGTSSGPIEGTAYASNIILYNQAHYSVGVSSATFNDTAGHYGNWAVDGSGRVTQVQVCSVTPAAGSPCPSANLLVTNYTWDANDNVTAVVDPRGAQTDIAYDGNGNVVAVAQPVQYQGWGRPTTLLDYDSYSNVVAVCDPVLVHSRPADWSGQYSGGSDSYCTSQFGSSGHSSAQYNYSLSYEPRGQLSSVTTAGGYVWQVSHDTGPQGGTDYGLTTKVGGASIMQADGSTRVPSTSMSYDANGNVICLQNDGGNGTPATPATTVMVYDGLGRLTATADPDDGSLASACGTKSPGIAGSSIVSRTTYYTDGSPQTVQSPSQAAANSGTVFVYDVDGNRTSESSYTSAPSNPQTATMRRWFDGMDRLVETQQPADPNTSGDIPLSQRFLYDLSQSGSAGTAATLTGATVTAHGNLFDTLKNTPTGWIDFTYSAFDAADRLTTAYAFAPCPAQPPPATGAIYCSQAPYATRYDWDSSSLNPSFSGNGLLVATLDGMNVSRMLSYDGLGELISISYSGDGGVTVQPNYQYDFDGRLRSATNTFSAASAPAQRNLVYSYTADGALAGESDNMVGQSTAYAYYPDGMVSGVSAYATSMTSGGQTYAVNQPNLYRYAYRNDGALEYESFGAANQSVSWAYTLGGRMTSQTDFNGTPSIAAQYGDGHGRLSSYATPSGTYGSFQYDALGRMVSYTDPGAAVDGETVTSTYDIRGDLVGRSFSGGTASSKPGFQYKNIQGVLLQNPSVDQWDGRTGAMLGGYAQSPEFTYDAIGRMTSGTSAESMSVLAYDAESRVRSGDSFAAASAEDADCHSGGSVAGWAPPPKEVSFLYDATGQLFQDRQPNTIVMNHIVQHYRQWAWSGSSALYTASVNPTWNGGIGTVTSYGGDGRGAIDPGTSALTLTDFDFDGVAAQYHNATGHSHWSAANPYNQFCISANALPASAGYAGPDSNVPAGGTVPDGTTSDAGLVVSSYGRAYLSTALGYTTPDFSSTTPYSRSPQATTSGSQRPVTDDPHCPSHYAYADGDKACLPPIGGTGTIVPPPGFEAIGPTGPLFGGHAPKQAPPVPKERWAGLPKNAKICLADMSIFFAPPVFNMNDVVKAGRAGGWNPVAMNAAVGHGGTFDYQRSRDRAGTLTHYPDYVNVSNFDVGAYGYGAGMGKSGVGAISDTFANLFSSQGATKQQADFRDLGWDTAKSGKPPICF